MTLASELAIVEAGGEDDEDCGITRPTAKSGLRFWLDSEIEVHMGGKNPPASGPCRWHRNPAVFSRAGHLVLWVMKGRHGPSSSKPGQGC